jgi:hypothetical protein
MADKSAKRSHRPGVIRSGPLPLQPPLPPRDRPLRHPQQPRRLCLPTLALQHQGHHPQPIPLTLTHRYPISVHPLSLFW